ncbi:MAG: hypothetical protein AB1801_04485 [Chloroflexota bacterium]
MELDDRTKILQILYQERAKSQSQALDSDELARQIQTSWDNIESDVIYLEEKGFVLRKRRQLGARIFQSLYLTSKGVDFIETGGADSVEALRRQLSQRIRNLNYLKEQAATYGVGELPLHLRNQIELERQAIEELETQLQKLAGK